ncbi:MAG: SDR family NAD(P)-dependent oxidoreductase, partial [Pseudonocardiaceae bacterium]
MARNVIVTGGGTGIGRAVAASFAAAGDTVVILGRRPEPLHRAAAELGPAVRAVVCDATDPAQVEALHAQLPTTVDVLVNSAGGNTDLARPSSDDLASLAANWRANLESNLLSAVLITTVVADRLTEGGAVISISSIT